MEVSMRQTVLAELQELFKHLDKDRDGLVIVVEIVNALKSKGIINSQSVKKEIAEKYEDGMNFQQFYDFVSK